MKRLLNLSIALLVGTALYAQNGTISGTVNEKANAAEPVPFANVVLAGTTIGATTDFDGNYSISAPSGTYDVVFSFIGYATDTIKGVDLGSGESKSLNHLMAEATEFLGTVTLVAEANRESASALILEQRKADQIVQNMGAQQLSKVGASDVAAGLTKVSGVSNVSSKNLVVRGMGDRYNNAQVNGLPIPTTNPDNKMPNLNLFPTEIVKNLQVTKTFDPSLYGDFAGGNVNIETKTNSDVPLFVIGIGSGFNSQVTGQRFVSSAGGSTDYLGIDDGTRAVPATAEGSNPYIAPNFNPIESKAPVSHSFDLLFSREKKVANGSFGLLLSASHSNDYTFQEGSIRTFNLQETATLNYGFKKWVYNTQSSGLAALSYRFNTGAKLSYNFLYANVSSDETRETRGSHFDNPDDIFTRRYTFQSSRIFVNQLHGSHTLSESGNFSMDWDLGYSTTFAHEPDRRQLVFFYDESQSEENRTYTPNARDRIDNHRFYNELNETEISSRADFKWILGYEDTEEASVKNTLKFGLQQRRKTREFDYRRFVYDLSSFSDKEGDADINNLDQYFQEEDFQEYQDNYNEQFLQEVKDPSSLNNFALTVGAAYGTYEHQINPRWKLSGGLRLEASQQYLTFLDQAISNLLNVSVINNVAVLPSLNVKTNLTENAQLKLSASKTISRPKFKELAPFEYSEVFAGVRTKGNPNLTNGEAYNFDARFELYANPGELFSITGFGKQLVNPIEKVMEASASGQLQTFSNVDGAIVAGAEVEYIKSLANLTDLPILNKMEASVNASYMYTQVQLTETSRSVNTNAERPLQGASPFLLNADLTYRGGVERPYSVTLTYNFYGDRLHAVGIQGLGDQYEQSAGALDVLFKASFTDRIDFGFKLRNLTNPTYRITQTNQSNPGDDLEINAFQRGISGSFSINISLN